MKDDKLLNWAQVCALLGCRRSYFYILINSGQLPHVRVGSTRGIRVLESDVLAFIHARSTGREEKDHEKIRTYFINRPLDDL